jgi:adenosylcobinamide-phosphate synthase
METALAFIELHSAYLSFMLVALCSFFFSLPKDLNPLSAFAVIFQQIARKVNLDTRSDSYKRLASILSFTIIFSPLALIISQLYIVAFKPLTIDIIILYVLLSWH